MTFYCPTQPSLLQERLRHERIEEEAQEARLDEMEQWVADQETAAMDVPRRPDAPERLSTFEVELLDAWMLP